jgi:hypothetical protein
VAKSELLIETVALDATLTLVALHPVQSSTQTLRSIC